MRYMDNLIFSLNATIPIFLLMVLGVFFRKVGLLKENMINGLNQFVFKATLPVLLFGDLAKQDFSKAWDGKFVAFCFMATLLSISLVALMSMALKDKSQRGEFIQGAYRSSACNFRNCVYHQYLWQFWYGTGHDHRQCAAL